MRAFTRSALRSQILPKKNGTLSLANSQAFERKKKPKQNKALQSSYSMISRDNTREAPTEALYPLRSQSKAIL